MRVLRSRSGLSMIEALVGTFIVVGLFLGIWYTYDANRIVWDRGRDKVLLQQALTQASEAIARDVRAGASVALTGSSDLTIFDRDGNVIRRYFRDGGASQLVTAIDEPIIPEKCTALSFVLSADTSEVRFQFTLKDRWENKATLRNSAHLRNEVGAFVAVQ